MKIYIGSDHAGFELKESLKSWLEENGHDIVDFGAHLNDADDDYPDFIFPVAEQVSEMDVSECPSTGIVLGGSGQGEAIAANRLKGVRAAVFYGGDYEIVRLARQHNDANILSLGARFLSLTEAKRAIVLFLETSFLSDARYARRIKKVKLHSDGK